MQTKPVQSCATCAQYIFKTKQWGDCCATRIPIRPEGKQHKDNGGNCPKYKPRQQ